MRPTKSNTPKNEFDNTLWSQNWSSDVNFIKQRGQTVALFNPAQRWHPAWGTLSEDGNELTVKFGETNLVGTIPLFNRDIIRWSNTGVWRRIPSSDERHAECKSTYEKDFTNNLNNQDRDLLYKEHEKKLFEKLGDKKDILLLKEKIFQEKLQARLLETELRKNNKQRFDISRSGRRISGGILRGRRDARDVREVRDTRDPRRGEDGEPGDKEEEKKFKQEEDSLFEDTKNTKHLGTQILLSLENNSQNNVNKDKHPDWKVSPTKSIRNNRRKSVEREEIMRRCLENEKEKKRKRRNFKNGSFKARKRRKRRKTKKIKKRKRRKRKNTKRKRR